MSVGFAFAQKTTEVLYFKANLGCCKARACNLLQCDVDSVVSKYFAKENVVFRVVSIADSANKALVEKYNAQSQTVILVQTKKKKEKVTDLTPIVDAYKVSTDKAKFEEEMKAKITEAL